MPWQPRVHVLWARATILIAVMDTWTVRASFEKNNLFWMVTHLALITGRYLTAKFRSTMLISVYVPSVGKLREYFLTWLTCLCWFSPQHSFWGIPSNRRWRMHGKYHVSVMHKDNTWPGDGAENVYRRAGAETLGSATKFKSQEAFKVSLTC